MGKELRIEVIKDARTESIVELYQDAGWWEEGWSEEVIPAMVANSFRFVGLFDGDELVGMGRALSDGVSDAYIQDIVVRTDYRGLGWGIRIVNRIVCELRDAGIDWIGLIGQPGTKNFYEKLSFNEMPEFVPMKYQC